MGTVTTSDKTTHGLFIGVDSTDGDFLGLASLAIRREEKRWFEIFQSALSVSTQTLINKYATKEAICRAIHETVSRTGQGERAVIVFYGHGGYVRKSVNGSVSRNVDFIVPYDANVDNLFTDGDLARILRETMNGAVNREIVFIFDCCRQILVEDLGSTKKVSIEPDHRTSQFEIQGHVFMSLDGHRQRESTHYSTSTASDSTYQTEHTMEWGDDESIESEPWKDQVLYIQSAQLDQYAQTTPTSHKNIEESYFGREYSRFRRSSGVQMPIPTYDTVLKQIEKRINGQSPWCYPESLATTWEAV